MPAFRVIHDVQNSHIAVKQTNRCNLKGLLDESLHAVLDDAGFDIRWLLCMIAEKGIGFFGACCRPVV
jgi:hypothetical protein